LRPQTFTDLFWRGQKGVLTMGTDAHHGGQSLCSETFTDLFWRGHRVHSQTKNTSLRLQPFTDLQLTEAEKNSQSRHRNASRVSMLLRADTNLPALT
jgi:transposase-like protein